MENQTLNRILLCILLVLCIVLFIIVIWKSRDIQQPRSATQEIIERIKSHTEVFVKRLADKFPNDERVVRLRNRYANTRVFESDNHETYTLNKGEEVVLCLRNYMRNKEIHDDMNLLIFVALHELAHIMCVSKGHTDEFWKDFKFILRNAAEMNMYLPIDYAYAPVEYCAMVVENNPYFNERTKREFIEELQNIVLTS